ncbi:hypothetical protein F5Y08DRAFT_336854 [Xylaria arbuscula]|nr:hypothetical protein F5Y08DRAFT_336854 [Xylaria arbuscula]
MALRSESAQLPSGSIEDSGPAFRAFVIFLITITILSTTLRFWSRSLTTPPLNRSRFWWDDWFAAAAMATSLVELSLVLRVVDLGFGQHIWAIPPSNLSNLLKALFPAEILLYVALVLAKTSALLFFGRVFQRYTNPRWFNIALWISHGLNSAWFLGLVLGLILLCNPVAKNWEPTLPGTCGKTSDLYLGNAISSVIIDVLILLLPVPMIWGVQASSARKVAITAVFILGYSSVIVTIGRLVTAIHAGKSVNGDFTYEGIPHYYWVVAEAPIMIVSISLPAMLPLARHIGQHYFQPLASSLSILLGAKFSTSDQSNDTNDSRSQPTTLNRTYLQLDKDTKSGLKRGGSYVDRVPDV